MPLGVPLTSVVIPVDKSRRKTLLAMREEVSSRPRLPRRPRLPSCSEPAGKPQPVRPKLPRTPRLPQPPQGARLPAGVWVERVAREIGGVAGEGQLAAVGTEDGLAGDAVGLQTARRGADQRGRRRGEVSDEDVGR